MQHFNFKLFRLQLKNTIFCSMICIIPALQLLFLVHYVEYRVEHGETQNIEGAAGADILMCLCTPGKSNKVLRSS